jgi:hypothetical protein
MSFSVRAEALEKPLDQWAAAAANVLPRECDFCGAAPGWSLGQQGYAFDKAGRVLAAVREKGSATSALLTLGAAAPHALESSRQGGPDGSAGLPYSFGGLVSAADGEALYMIGAGPATPAGVYSWKPSASEARARAVSC